MSTALTPAPQPVKAGFLSRLYTGTGAFEIIGKRRIFYLITLAIVLLSALGIGVRGFNLTIDFTGGTEISMPTDGTSDTAKVREVVQKATGKEVAAVQVVGSGAAQTYQIQTTALDEDAVTTTRSALYDAFAPKDREGQPSAKAISFSEVSDTWGSQITRQALIALVVFLVVVTAYIALRFREWDMALASLVSLFFDVIVTAGVYAWVGFDVSPATVIGLLTILGFSLYDTVVVFDKVDENVRGVFSTTRRTYAEQANLAVNQTLMRSVNTTVISALPILSLMVVAAWLLGVGTLMDLGLIQLVGVLIGTFSSVALASPMLVTLKEQHKSVKAHNAKVARRRAAVDAAEANDTVTGDAATGGAADTETDVVLDKRVTPASSARPQSKTRPQSKRAHRRG
jgi:preprotein translocase subunit SecF